MQLSVISIILIMISSFTHAGWNLLSKSDNPSISYFLVGNTTGITIFLPLLIIYFDKLKFIPLSVWILLIITGFLEAMYYSSLAYGYRVGEMSLVYPMARSLPVVIVTIFMLLIGKMAEISTLYLVGCLLIVVGLFIMPLREVNKKTIMSIFNKSAWFALLAALGTAGYSIVDDRAVRILKNVSGGIFSSIEGPLIYMVFIGIFSSIWLGVFVLCSKEEREKLPEIINHSKKGATLMGLGIYFTYGIILISMLFVKNVGYVVAFRQLSIPIGAILGVLVLKESVYPLKIVGTIITLFGLLIVSMA